MTTTNNTMIGSGLIAINPLHEINQKIKELTEQREALIALKRDWLEKEAARLENKKAKWLEANQPQKGKGFSPAYERKQKKVIQDTQLQEILNGIDLGLDF